MGIVAVLVMWLVVGTLLSFLAGAILGRHPHVR